MQSIISMMGAHFFFYVEKVSQKFNDPGNEYDVEWMLESLQFKRPINSGILPPHASMRSQIQSYDTRGYWNCRGLDHHRHRQQSSLSALHTRIYTKLELEFWLLMYERTFESSFYPNVDMRLGTTQRFRHVKCWRTHYGIFIYTSMNTRFLGLPVRTTVRL